VNATLRRPSAVSRTRPMNTSPENITPNQLQRSNRFQTVRGARLPNSQHCRVRTNNRSTHIKTCTVLQSLKASQGRCNANQGLVPCKPRAGVTASQGLIPLQANGRPHCKLWCQTTTKGGTTASQGLALLQAKGWHSCKPRAGTTASQGLTPLQAKGWHYCKPRVGTAASQSWHYCKPRADTTASQGLALLQAKG
jgi:hypothetical protein